MMMDFLLSTPFVWKSNKICRFYEVAFNHIKEVNDNQELKKIKRNFEEKIDREGKDAGLWLPEDNWEALVVPEVYKILTTKYETKKNKIVEKTINIRDNSGVSKLLAIMRNKAQHANALKEQDKKIVDWFDTNGRFSKIKYSQFWINLNSSLLPYLWYQFYEWRDAQVLKDFYPCEMGNYTNERLDDLMDFPCQIEKALQEQLDKGEVLAKYKTEDETILEFRTLATDTIQHVLDGYTTIKISVSANQVCCYWFKSCLDIPSDEKVYKINCLHTKDFSETTIIIGNSVDDVEKYIETDVATVKVKKRVIIFIKRSSNKKAALRDINDLRAIFENNRKSVSISEEAIIWEDVSYTAQQNIIENGILVYQNHHLKINEISGSTAQKEVLNRLSGNVLNELLSDQTAEVFKGVCIPALSIQDYQNRTLVNREEVDSSIFEAASEHDIFLVVNMCQKNVAHILMNKYSVKFVPDPKKIKIEDALDYKIFAVECDLKDCDELIIKIQKERNIHCLRYTKEKTFKWLNSIGSIFAVEKQFTKASEQLGVLTEKQFLEKLEENGEKIIFINGEPGIGKTQLFISLTSSLIKKYDDRLVLFISYNDFMEKVDKGDEKQALRSLINIICPDNLLEQHLLKYWLEDKNLKIELVLDAMDELGPDVRKIAFQTLATIQDMPSVRCWVSARDHMLDNIIVKFKKLGYKLKGFTKTEQIDNMTNHWYRYLQKNSGDAEVLKPRLKDYAGKCIEDFALSSKNDVASIPLHLRLLAEIHEKNIFNADYTLNKYKGTVVELYQCLLDSKYQVYIQEKVELAKTGIQLTSAKILREEAIDAHLYFALKLIFSEDQANGLYKWLGINTKYINKENFILNIGIVKQINPVVFVHRTLPEFIIAKFICDVLNGKYKDEVVSMSDDIFQNLLLNHVLTATCIDQSLISKCELNHPMICHFLNLFLDTIQFQRDEHLLSLIVDTQKQLSRDSILKEFFRRRVPFFEMAINMELNSLIQFTITLGSNLLSFFIAMLESCQYDMCKYIITTYHSRFGPENWKITREYDERKFGILHWVIMGALKRFSLPIVLQSVMVTAESIIDFVKYIESHNRCVIEDKDAKGRTPFLLLMEGEPDYFTEVQYLHGDDTDENCRFLKLVNFFIKDLKTKISATDNEGNNAFHYVHNYAIETEGDVFLYPGYFPKCFDVILETDRGKELINSKNKIGQTPLIRAIEILGKKVVTCLGYFRLWGADFNIKDSKGNPVLNIAIEMDFEEKFIADMIMNYKLDISAKNSVGKCALHLASQRDNINLVKLLAAPADPDFRANAREIILQDVYPHRIRHLLDEILFRTEQRPSSP